MKALSIAIGLVLALASAAPAASVRVDFSGTVVEIGVGDEPGDLASDVTTSVSIGTPFAGYFTFDDAEAPYASTESEADYVFASPQWTLETTLGDYVVQPAYDDFNPTPPPGVFYRISVYDSEEFGDGVSVGGLGSSASGAGADSFTLRVGLDIYAPDLVSSTALADVPWDFSLYEAGQVVWYFERDNQIVEVWGAINGVPEPRLGALASLALLALGFRRIQR